MSYFYPPQNKKAKKQRCQSYDWELVFIILLLARNHLHSEKIAQHIKS